MNADQITLPMVGWTVQPSFRLKEVTLVEACRWVSAPGWFKTDTGKAVHASQFHASRGDAIKEASAALDKQQADLKARTDRLLKRRQQLEKEAAK